MAAMRKQGSPPNRLTNGQKECDVCFNPRGTAAAIMQDKRDKARSGFEAKKKAAQDSLKAAELLKSNAKVPGAPPLPSKL